MNQEKRNSSRVIVNINNKIYKACILKQRWNAEFEEHQYILAVPGFPGDLYEWTSEKNILSFNNSSLDQSKSQNMHHASNNRSLISTVDDMGFRFKNKYNLLSCDLNDCETGFTKEWFRINDTTNIKLMFPKEFKDVYYWQKETFDNPKSGYMIPIHTSNNKNMNNVLHMLQSHHIWKCPQSDIIIANIKKLENLFDILVFPIILYPNENEHYFNLCKQNTNANEEMIKWHIELNKLTEKDIIPIDNEMYNNYQKKCIQYLLSKYSSKTSIAATEYYPMEYFIRFCKKLPLILDCMDITHLQRNQFIQTINGIIHYCINNGIVFTCNNSSKQDLINNLKHRQIYKQRMELAMISLYIDKKNNQINSNTNQTNQLNITSNDELYANLPPTKKYIQSN